MFTETFILTIALGILVIILVLSKKPLNYRARRILLNARSTEMSVKELLELDSPRSKKRGRGYLLCEQTVKSVGHRYAGRLDAAVMSWEEVPTAHLVVERKFPVNHLPKAARQEDFFQAGLYALALLETGVSCSSTLLMIIYCLQDRAKRCMEKPSRQSCASCGDARVFVSRFNQNQLERTLERLDEVWFSRRPPRPTRRADMCRICPFGAKGTCNYELT
ncbi:hypothetical protein EU546_01990 [Candidatus Thorarchaeota archaeon]|nr:MAG: hypothetical protein EU546_01990 [Candidatus Thorarchaeota archaeon]